jgi:hypothetical protein
MEKFWMVWNENGGSPTCQHPSLESAETEAARLARMKPGSNFVVLESVKFCTIDDPVKWYPTDEDPF